MPDVFISYSNQDEKLAQFVYRHLTSESLSVFLASVSLKPGDHWPSEIMNNLRFSPWVILLASRAACRSPFVQQELGGARYGNKKIIPIVWDMSPSKLPGWAREYQALDLAGATIESLSKTISSIAKNIKADKGNGLLLVGCILLGLLLFKK
ncbi:MAG TPA: toll/interleukin-1 receptor domain-containing protein [Sedimentisphaerales bacterium]|nr:toll/interleukin-1 receptor domain-containing protein [Sedimentisphaerales bacterium]